MYYFWCFSVCIYDDLALYYASGSSKNDVTMMEQVSIVKRAKFIVRTKRTIPKTSLYSFGKINTALTFKDILRMIEHF